MVVGLAAAAAAMSNTQDRGLGIALAETLELFQWTDPSLLEKKLEVHRRIVAAQRTENLQRW
jgi:hypothetical protein